MAQVQRNCPVCSHSSATPAYDNRMASVNGLDMSYCIARCQGCGFHYARQLADNASFQAYYSTASKYDVASQVSAVDQARIDAAVAICRTHLPKDARIVDLGCGYGALLASLKRAGWTDLQGVDPAPKSAQRAMELFQLGNIHCATMDTAHTVVALDQADVVCVMAVLEHLPSLRADMAALLARLRPGCKLLIEVPTLECFATEGAEPFGEFSLEHIQFFSAVSLRNLFGSLGARTLATQTVDLPMVKSGDLFGLFENTGSAADHFVPEVEGDQLFLHYVQRSRQTLGAALQRIPQQPLVIYGAGSHTARLIPLLEKSHGEHLIAVVDGNPNLIGKTMGRWTIEAPSMLDAHPELAVLVSSFRSQNEIASSLRQRLPNALVLMYA